MKYKLGQEVWYMHNNKICSAPVLSRCMVENAHDSQKENLSLDERRIYTQFGKTDIRYSTIHMILSERETYQSVDELIGALRKD